MKNFFDFIEEQYLSILIMIFLLGLIVLIIIGEYQFAIADNNDLEKGCYEFYKENNYILEECNKYSDKLKGE